MAEDGAGDPIKIANAVVEVMTIAFEAMVANGIIAKTTMEQVSAMLQLDAQSNGERERAAVFSLLRTYLAQPAREELLALLRVGHKGSA